MDCLWVCMSCRVKNTSNLFLKGVKNSNYMMEDEIESVTWADLPIFLMDWLTWRLSGIRFTLSYYFNHIFGFSVLARLIASQLNHPSIHPSFAAYQFNRVISHFWISLGLKYHGGTSCWKATVWNITEKSRTPDTQVTISLPPRIPHDPSDHYVHLTRMGHLASSQ